MSISGMRRVSSVLTSVINTASKITNRQGESGQPCLMPEPCGWKADLVLVSLTSKVGSVYTSWMMSTYVVGVRSG